MGARRTRLALAAALWLLVALASWIWLARQEAGVVGTLSMLLDRIDEHPLAPVLLLLLFLVRPVTLLPVTVVTAFSGFLLGPLLGFATATLAVTATSLIPYLFTRAARGTRRTSLPAEEGWRRTLATHPFEAVLAARLAMMPGDLVNVASGLLRVPMPTFLVATALGGAPGVTIGVLAGASLHGAFRFEGVQVDAPLLLASAGVMVLSLIVSRVLARRTHVAPNHDTADHEKSDHEKWRPRGRR